MNKRCLIDTDVLVDYLYGLDQAIQFLQEHVSNIVCCLSIITIAELYAGGRDGKERLILDQFIREFQSIALNESIAKLGGLYRRNYGKSHGVGLADALIAASAEEHNLKLITLNKKHYPMLKDVVVPYQKNTQ